MATLLKHPFLPLPYSIGICIIARKPQSYSGGRVWAAPTKKSNKYNALFVMQKNKKDV